MADFVCANENRFGSGERPGLSRDASAHRSGAILVKPGVSHSRRSAGATVGLQEELRASLTPAVPSQAIRSRMEIVVGADFSTVRIHDPARTGPASPKHLNAAPLLSHTSTSTAASIPYSRARAPSPGS